MINIFIQLIESRTTDEIAEIVSRYADEINPMNWHFFYTRARIEKARIIRNERLTRDPETELCKLYCKN